MKIKILAIAGVMLMGLLASCNKDLITYEQGDIKIFVEKGDEWLHDFSLFWGIEKKNPPQIAIWIEDMSGSYIATIYATHKIATESWQSNGGNRRKESLPVWCYSRGIQYPDGLYLPTKEKPLVDGISGATPHGSFDVRIRPVGNLRRFIVKIEVNHSADWNDAYPKNAKEGNSNYSGGKEGSGQPAVVYSTAIDLDSSQKQYKATIVGHSSPDGSDSEIYTDVSCLTSALKIVKEITINIQ